MVSSNLKIRIWIVTGSVITCLVLWTICYRYVTGYYPIPEIVRRLHYINMLCENDDVSLKVILIDEKFLLNKKGYVATAAIEGAEPLVYCLGASFEGLLPMDYAFKGQVLLEIEKDRNVIYSRVIKGTEANSYAFGEDHKPYGINGFDIHTLPFYIAHKKYQNSIVRVTVTEEDLGMYDHIDSVTISLYPILRE